MPRLYQILFVFCCLAGCKADTEQLDQKTAFRLIITDSSDFNRRRINRFAEIARQLGMKDLKAGADDFEIRAWYHFMNSVGEELTILRRIDTNYMATFFRIYPRSYKNDPRQGQGWEKYEYPILDSVVSKTIWVPASDVKDLNVDGFWKIASQSEPDTLKHFGFNDCDSYVTEVADRNRYKFITYECPRGNIKNMNYYDELAVAKFYSIVDSINVKYKVLPPTPYFMQY
jgi:hypothetical protein